jgi:hypothetical protein
MEKANKAEDKKEKPMRKTMNVRHQNKPYQEVVDQGCTKQEIEECVALVRLELYNQAMPCGTKSVQERLKVYDVKPLPSESSIARIFARRGLTHGRTGSYR